MGVTLLLSLILMAALLLMLYAAVALVQDKKTVWDGTQGCSGGYHGA